MYTKRFKPKRVKHKNKFIREPNLQTRKLYESISHKLGKPRFQVKPSPYMRDWKPVSRKRNWRLDISDSPIPRTLGICIMCHGAIGYLGKTPIVDVPDGITLHKKNLGGCGEKSYGLYKIVEYPLTVKVVKNLWEGTKIKPPPPPPQKDVSSTVEKYVNDCTRSTLTHFDSCIDIPSYKYFASKYIPDQSFSCQMFSGPQFYSKRYSFAPYTTELITYTNNYIMFTYLSSTSYKTINIVTCSQAELDDFFGTTKDPITIAFMKTKQERIDNSKKIPPINFKLTTEDIFELIKHAQQALDITNVNMLDLSCNEYSGTFVRDPKIGF